MASSKSNYNPTYNHTFCVANWPGFVLLITLVLLLVRAANLQNPAETSAGPGDTKESQAGVPLPATLVRIPAEQRDKASE